MDKITLIKSCQLGDLESFEKLYKIYSKNAMGTAYLISKHKGIAEDIVQEAFFQCYREIKKLRDPNAFDVWFYRLLVRLAWKISSKQKAVMAIEATDYEVNICNNFDLKLDFEETRLIVHNALNKLSPPLRTVIVLYYFNDMTIKQISKVLGCFQGTIKSRLYNAKRILKEELCEKAEEDTNKSKFMVKECKTNG